MTGTSADSIPKYCDHDLYLIIKFSSKKSKISFKKLREYPQTSHQVYLYYPTVNALYGH